MKRYYFTFMHLNNKIGAKASLTKIWGIGHQRVKNLPAMQETWVQSLDQEDSLEKGMATHSSILGWRIPWTEESGGLLSMRLQSWARLSRQAYIQQRIILL